MGVCFSLLLMEEQQTCKTCFFLAKLELDAQLRKMELVQLEIFTKNNLIRVYKQVRILLN